MDKIEDFGVHADQYYPLKVEIYKTKLDEKLLELLWNKYWVATLSQSLILSVRPDLLSRRDKKTVNCADLTEPLVRNFASRRPQLQDRRRCR